MTEQLLLDQFEILTEAPNGIAKLRELILQLAVQGKLVPQDPSDEPAFVLLEKIKAEKERLIREGKIRKSKPPQPITSDAVPYGIPPNWAWTQLIEIGIINPTNEIDNEMEVSFVPMRLIPDGFSGIVESECRTWADIRKGFTHFAENDVVMAKITPCFQNRKSAVMRRLTNGVGAGTTELHVFRSIDDYVNSDYVLLYLKSPHFIGDGVSKMTGSAGQKRVPRDYFSSNPFPLPPLEEQKQIVAIVDQFMALCDELEKQQSEKKETKLKLNRASLNGLTTASSKEELTTNWHNLQDSFALLYNTSETIPELRQAVLQLAVQGKLVPQDPSDEAASVLLEKIKSEKECLIKEGKIKKEKPLPQIRPEEISYELPQSWEWVRFTTVILSSEAGWSPQCKKREREGNEWGVLKVSAVSWNVFKPQENKALPSELEPRPQYEVKAGDFLLSRANTLELVAKSIVVEESHSKLMMSDKLIRLHLSESVERRFFNIFNNCSTAREYYAQRASGTSSSMRNVSRECILKMFVPLPPLEEQKRIVAKVDQLMALCDELEDKLKQSTNQTQKLLESIVWNLACTGER